MKKENLLIRIFIMKKRFLSLLLILCLLINVLFAVSCVSSGDENNDDSADHTDPADLDIEDIIPADKDFELSPPPADKPAIIHMIQPVDDLADWQAGKTEHSASLYVDDMMKVLDALDWQGSGESFAVSSDFDFRINLHRSKEEMDAFASFFASSEDENETDTAEPDTEGDSQDGYTAEAISVQYLINYEDRLVNMRLSDYSALTFDIYAELEENEMRLLILCLKYYFGPGQ